MNDPFATLGVPARFSFATGELEQRHRDLSRALHPDRYVNAPASERRVALERAVSVNDAFRALKDPLARAQSLLALHGLSIREGERAAPALLMEIMELREELDTVRTKPDRVASLRAQVDAHVAAEERVVAEVFDREGPIDAKDLSRARDAVVKLRYYKRFQEEADALDE